MVTLETSQGATVWKSYGWAKVGIRSSGMRILRLREGPVLRSGSKVQVKISCVVKTGVKLTSDKNVFVHGMDEYIHGG